MEKVSVEISGFWVRLINSPIYWVIAALSGVSITFVPSFLYNFGRDGVNRSNWQVLVCYMIIYAVPGFYMLLASSVIRQVKKK